MKHLLFLILISLATKLPAQDLEAPKLPADSILIASLISYQNRLDSAELKRYKIKYKNQWLTYLPSLGVTYVTGKARPIANMNFGYLTDYYRTREIRRAEKLSIESKQLINNEQEIQNLRRAIRRYKTKALLYKEHQELHKIDEKLLEFAQAKLDKNKIIPSTFYREKKRVHQSRMNSLAYYHELSDMYISVLEKAKFIETYPSPSKVPQSPSK